MLFVEEKWKIERDCLIQKNIENPRELATVEDNCQKFRLASVSKCLIIQLIIDLFISRMKNNNKIIKYDFTLNDIKKYP